MRSGTGRDGRVMTGGMAVVNGAPFLVLGLPQHESPHGSPPPPAKLGIHLLSGVWLRREFSEILLGLFVESFILRLVARGAHGPQELIYATFTVRKIIGHDLRRWIVALLS